MAERRPWSLISVERLAAYGGEAARVIDFCQREKISLFAAALAGAHSIHSAIKTMGGELDWWVRLIRDPNWILECVVDAGDGAPAPGPAGKQ